MQAVLQFFTFLRQPFVHITTYYFFRPRFVFKDFLYLIFRVLQTISNHFAPLYISLKIKIIIFSRDENLKYLKYCYLYQFINSH